MALRLMNRLPQKSSLSSITIFFKMPIRTRLSLYSLRKLLVGPIFLISSEKLLRYKRIEYNINVEHLII